MKKRIVSSLMLLVVFVLFLTACDLIDNLPDLGIKDNTPTHTDGDLDSGNVHTHDFSERNNSSLYLKSSATCTAPAFYYYSCSCGERGSEAFTDGEAIGHQWTGGDCEEPMTCSACGAEDNKPRGHVWESVDEWTMECISCGLVVNTNDHTHTWTMADCLLPKTCSVCSATEGEANGHEWKDATCINPKTCLSCGITEGELGNHDYVNKTCTNCGVSEPATYTQYSIKVASKGGLPLSGVTVYVHSGDGYNLCALPEITDENGVVTFLLETSDDYSVELDGAPDGYDVKVGQTRDDRYSLTDSYTVITLTSAPITTGTFKPLYKLGDVMYDFTLTDVNGKSYKLSELLGEKDMVMLNFWFATCPPCRREFPYINTVYKEFMDEVEILAINDYDTKADILSYSESFSEKLIIPMFTNGDLSLSNFPSIGYPTTVIIDRYGVICMIEVGAVTGETPWRNLFEHFTADEYEQKLLEGIDSV